MSAAEIALSSPVVQQALPLLSVQDTIHDFWDGGRGEANPIDDIKLANLRAGIDRLILAVGTPIDQATFGEIHKTSTGAWIDKPAKYERNVIKNWEKQLPTHLYSQTKETVTYDEILNNFDALVAKYNASRGFCNILSIVPAPDTFFDSFDTSQRNRIANFVLIYMGLSAQPVFGVTYDAGPVAVRKTFADISQGYTYIYPQNISDSAVTSFKSKRNNFIFPVDSVVKSNLFTKSSVQIQFQNRGFSNLNPYGFNWLFRDPTGQSLSVPFSADSKDGPSVNYLADSLMRGVGPATSNKKAGMVDLTPIIGAVESTGRSLLLDLKRSGDFEQVHASLGNTECIFSTIDHLCSFYARMLHKNCIWSNNSSSEMILYRFPTATLSPRDQKILQVCLFSSEQSRRLTLIQNMEASGLLQAYNEFAIGTTAIFTLRPSIVRQVAVAFTNPTLFTPAEVVSPDAQSILSDAIGTAFMRYKCADTARYIETLITTIQSTRASIISSIGGELIANINVAAGGPSALSGISDEILDRFSTAVLTIKSQIETIQPFLDLQLSNLDRPLYSQIFKQGVLNTKASNLTFGFSNGILPYVRGKFRSLIGILTSTRESRDRLPKITRHLAEFFEARSSVLNTFYDREFSEQIESISDIVTSDLADKSEDDAINTILTRTLAMAQTMISQTSSVTLPQKGGASLPDSVPQRGMGHAERVGQTLDTAYIFRDICGKAADYVNSKISEGGNPAIDLVDCSQLIRASPVASVLVSDLQEYWESELVRIRETAKDVYGYEYEPNVTDDCISLILAPPSSTGEPNFYFGGINPRNVPVTNDLWRQILLVPEWSSIHSRTLILLTLFDNMMSTAETPIYLKGYTLARGLSFDAPREWDTVPNGLMTVLSQMNMIKPKSFSRDQRSLFSGGKRRKTRNNKSKKNKTYRRVRLF